jgi:ERCC4-type nuclease
VKGYEDRVAIERKSIDDMVGCLKGENRDRFERELARSRELEYFALAVECNLMHLINHQYTSAMLPKSVIQSIITFSVRYKLPVFFCENHRYAGRIVESLLTKYVREVRLSAGTEDKQEREGDYQS